MLNYVVVRASRPNVHLIEKSEYVVACCVASKLRDTFPENDYAVKDLRTGRATSEVIDLDTYRNFWSKT